MPPVPRSVRHSALTLAALLALLPKPGHAAFISSTFVGPDNGLWSNASNWSNGTPNNGGTLTYGALVTGASRTVVVDIGVTVDTLSVGSLNTVSINGALAVATGSIVNNGTISLSGPIPSLQIKADTLLSGGGAIVLSSPASNIDGIGVVRLISDNTITGQGSIGSGSLKIINTASMTATTGTLTLRPNAQLTMTDAFINLGTLAADGGTLSLGTGYYNNTGGIIQARNNSVVLLGSTSIINGGSLGSTGNGTVTFFGGAPATLSNVSLSGLVQTLGITLTGNITNAGTLTNLGGPVTLGANATAPVMLVNAGLVQVSSASNLTLLSDATLAGGGTIALDGGSFSSTANGSVPWRLTNQTFISGKGTLGSNGTGAFITNSGTINAVAGLLTIYGSSYTGNQNNLNNINAGTLRASEHGTLALTGSGIFTLGYRNTGGTIEALTDSVVAITNTTIFDGTIRAAEGGTITFHSATFDSVTFAGGLLQAAGTTSILTLSGAIDNASTLTLAGSLSLGTSQGATLTLHNAGLINVGKSPDGPPTSMMVWANTSLTGGGTVSLNKSGFLQTASASIAPRFSSDNFIFGTGTLGSGGSNGTLLTNSGTITATGGLLTIVNGFNSNFTTPLPSSYNTGTLRADGGTLSLIGSPSSVAAPIINDGGVIEALPGSLVTIGTCTITGGNIRALPGGTVTLQATSIADVTLDGFIQAANFPLIGVSGAITNNGLLRVGNLDNGTVVNAGLGLATDSSFTGTGTISLRGASIYFAGFSSSITHFTNSTLITGHGNIGSSTTSPVFAVANSGTITATDGVMTVYDYAPTPSQTPWNNTGVLRADGGTLIITSINSTGFNNNDGLIEARPNSFVTIGNVFLTGGAISALPGGTVTLSGVTLGSLSLKGLVQATSVTVYPSISNAGTLVATSGIVAGISNFNPLTDITIANTGLIQIGQTTSGITSGLSIMGNLFLSGGGSVTLNSTLASPQVSSTARLTSNNIITGKGTLTNGNMIFTNSGTITASGGTLALLSAASSSAPSDINQGLLRAQNGTLVISASSFRPAFDNSGGIIEAGTSSVVSFVNRSIQGGVIRSVNGGTVSLTGTVLTNTNIQGNFQLVTVGNTLTGVQTATGDVTVNSSQIALNFGSSSPISLTLLNNSHHFQLASGFPVNITGDLLLSGGGTFTLSGNLVNFLSPSRLLSDNLILGRGTLSNNGAKITNAGSIIATTGILTVQTSFSSDGFLSTGILGADGGTLSLTSVLNATAGSIQTAHGGIINFNGGSFLIACPIILNTGAVNFLSGSSPASNSAASISGVGTLSLAKSSFLTSDGVTVSNLSLSGTHMIRAGDLTPAAASPGTSKVNAITLATATGGFIATLDLTNNKFILQADTLPQSDKLTKASYLQSALLSGMHNGDWLGTGITSSTVAADSSLTGSHLTTLALLDNAVFGFTDFGGQQVDNNSLLITSARLADANFDGQVNGTDLDAWYSHRLGFSPFTNDGDFNHDGGVDGLDFDLWLGAAGGSAQQILASRGLSAGDLSALRVTPVPEPASLTLLATASAFMLSRRRAKSHKRRL